MSTENKIRVFVVKILLCSLGLFFGVLLLAPKAQLQNRTNTAATNAFPNTRATPMPTPRVNRAGNTRVNARANAIANVPQIIIDDLEPAPTPTPPANSTIRGRVFYGDTGRAVKRGSIILMSENLDDGPSSAPSAVTDSQGYFQMKNVRAGTYYAVINAPGVVSPLAFFDASAARASGEKAAFAKGFAFFERIVVDGITSVDVEIPAFRGGAVGGRVTYDDGDPAIGVRVEILRKVDDKFVSVIPNFSTIVSMRTGGTFQTDDRGVYRFPGLPPGEYIVKVTESAVHGDIAGEGFYLDPFNGPVTNSFLTIFYPDGFDPKSAQLIEVGAGQEVGEINLIIPSRALYKLEGKIVAAKDKKPVKAKITIEREVEDNTFSVLTTMSRAREQSTSTDEEGNWKFRELPKGNYRIVVQPVSGDGQYQQYSGNSIYPNNMISNRPLVPMLAKKAQIVTIDDKDISDLVIEVGYGATIAGTVAVENSREMPKSLTVRAYNETDKLSVLDYLNNYYIDYSSQPQNPNHDFTLENVTAGKNRLSLEIDEDDFYVKSATLGGVDLLANPLEVKEGDVLRNVRIVLSKGVGTLKGTVTDAQNKPVAGVQFSLAPVDVARRQNVSLFRRARTDRAGAFEIKIAPGEYAIVIFNEDIKDPEAFFKWLDTAVKEAQKVKIEAGKTETVAIKNFK